jgi:hypothetical protein
MRPAFRSLWSFAAAFVLLALFVCGLYSASETKSPAWDEPGHIAAGAAYVQRGSLAVNPQHPPLLKALSGIGLTFSGAQWPDVPQARDLLNGDQRWQWDIGSLMLIKAGVDRALRWARLPMMLVGVLAGVVIFLWGRQIGGDLAGLCGLLLYVLDPTIAGHAFLVTLDVGLGAFSLLFLFCLWNYVRAPGRATLAFSGVTLGLALCTKFSSIVLLPVGALHVLAASFASRNQARTTPVELLIDPPAKPKQRRKSTMPIAPSIGWKWLTSSAVSLLWIVGIAAAIVLMVYRFHGFGGYIDGMTRVNADHSADYKVYLSGDLAVNFSSYFAAAYLLKEPLAAIALAAIGLWILLRGAFTLRDKLFLVLPPVAIFVLHTWKADNLGIRYIIPCLMFAHLLGGIALASLLRSPRIATRAVGALLVVWLGVAAAGIYPDGLSYFNESACLLDKPGKLGLDGGSRCGIGWLDDSNVDWGGGLKQLQTWLASNARGRDAKLIYFGSFPPGAYEAPIQEVDPGTMWFQPPPGLYAVSAHTVAHNTALVRHGFAAGDEWMQRLPPRAIVGHCLYIFDIR